MDKKKKKRKVCYSPRKLAKALQSIEDGNTPAQASREYNIPRTTLIYKSSGKRPKEIHKPGPECFLGVEVEKIVASWILEASKKGFGLMKDGLRYTVNQLIKEGHVKNQIPKHFNKDNGPSRRWFDSFFKRHPELKFRTAEYLHKCRSFATEGVIRNWFEKVKTDMKELMKLFNDPSKIYNCDETAIYLHPKKPPVIAEKGVRHVYDVGETSNKENVTVLVVGNAKGELAPPLALFSFERIPTIFKENNPSSWGVGRSKTGLMTSETFYEYVANVFYPHVQDNLPVVLIMDGHKSHLSYQLSKFCNEHQIILIALPPNAMHILQPLDVTFFGPLKTDWSKTVANFKLQKNGGKDVERHHVIPLLDSIISTDRFKSNLSQGFAKCGLCPFNPNAVDYKKCLGSSTSSQSDSLNGVPNEAMLKELEERIPASILRDFQQNNSTTWMGDLKLCSLYCFWQSLQSDKNFEDIFSTHENQSANVYYVVESSPDNDGFEDNFTMYDYSNTHHPPRDFDNMDDNELIRQLANFNSNNETESRLGSENSTSGSESTSSSGSKSVKDVLSSIIRFPQRPDSDSDKATEKKARKKLDLPSVMTTEKWPELKKAIEDERDEVEQKKEERKKEQLEKKEVKEAQKLRIAEKKNNKKTKKRKNPIKKPGLIKKKTTTRNVLSDPQMELSVGDWLVVSYKNKENFVAKFLKVKNGRMIGNFLRPAVTRDHEGFVYKYPEIKDHAPFTFDNVKQILIPPAEYGRRGLLKFNISHNDLRLL